MKAKLEKLKKINTEEEYKFQEFIGQYQRKEQEKRTLIMLYCLIYLKESVNSIKIHNNV